MKTKLFFVAVLFFASVGLSYSQTTRQTPEQKCEKLTNEMIAFYGLSDTQAKAIEKVNLKYFQDDLNLRLEYKHNTSELTSRSKSLMEQYDRDILVILESSQQTTYRTEVIKRNENLKQKK